ncbi:Predicted deacylase [Cellvibrio japonicus Ueda107]|uniref:Predicted deacylase n=2 Tax=Cellvibrio japonicus TaxID=155077 RepID=B3PIG2_CELJU|nr:Predicted deacylase [Cellvibrio japonicus Ueda107]
MPRILSFINTSLCFVVGFGLAMVSAAESSVNASAAVDEPSLSIPSVNQTPEAVAVTTETAVASDSKELLQASSVATQVIAQEPQQKLEMLTLAAAGTTASVHASSSLANASSSVDGYASSAVSPVENPLAQAASSVSSVSSVDGSVNSSDAGLAAEVPEVNKLVDMETLLGTKTILDTQINPNSYVRLTWNSDVAVGGFSEATPVLVVNGASPGKTLCLVGAIHGDELNGIEMIRQVVFSIEPSKLTGTIIGVPVANIMGFRRNSRYLPDRRDWNRYFPGNTYGSSASRLAHSFFTRVITHCDALVDLHTGSFHRTNLPQLRADLADENVARLAQSFGDIAVLNSRGNPNSLRAAAVRAGIPSVTLEAGEPMAMQSDVVVAGVAAINTLLAKTGMYGKQRRWNRIAPVYYRSVWVRANQSGILFSKVTLGKRVKEGELLGTVTDPITNARTSIYSPYDGRVLGMALDQVVLPGFAAYHIGIQTPESILIEESQLNEPPAPEVDEEDGDDAGVDPTDDMQEPETGVSKAQDRMADG